MASSNPRKLQSQMTDALSCVICFQPYDLDGRVPKVFPCLHTLCLVCAEELCQQECGDTFPCPTCRQPVPIPSKGASGLKTNLDVSNMVEIMQGTTGLSVASPDCPDHPSKPISNVCMVCKVGLCTKCFTSSAMKQHSDHKVVEIDDAFDEIAKTCDALVKEGKETCQAIQEKRNEIERMTMALQAARASKCLSIFEIIEKLSRLLTTRTTPSNEEHSHAVSNLLVGEHLPDRNCTGDTLQLAFCGLDHGRLHFQKTMEKNATPESIACTKLASVTILLDLLRLKLQKNKYDGSVKALTSIWELCYESEPCSHRVVLLGGADLLVSYFEATMRNKDICRGILGVYVNLALCPSLHTNVMSTRAVKMIVQCIQNFTPAQGKFAPDQLPIALGSLSLFLCNTTVKWPEKCLSREEASKLVTDTCKKLSLDQYTGISYEVSFQPLLSMMSQQVSQAAKYWAVWIMCASVHQNPNRYCDILIRDGGLSVLKQQHSAPKHVQKLSKLILSKANKYTG